MCVAVEQRAHRARRAVDDLLTLGRGLSVGVAVLLIRILTDQLAEPVARCLEVAVPGAGDMLNVRLVGGGEHGSAVVRRVAIGRLPRQPKQRLAEAIGRAHAKSLRVDQIQRDDTDRGRIVARRDHCGESAGRKAGIDDAPGVEPVGEGLHVEGILYMTPVPGGRVAEIERRDADAGARKRGGQTLHLVLTAQKAVRQHH